MHRNVQLVAVRILKVQEFGRDAAGFQRGQTEVTSDTVFFVHDGRSRFEIIELANDRFGVPVTSAPALSRLRPFPE